MRFLKPILFCALLMTGCKDEVDVKPYDMALDARGGGGPCVDNSDCPSPEYICAYKIADGCAAKGYCAHVAVPTCASVVELCGCDGKEVISGPCNFADGYASGPTTGAPISACGDGGAP